MEWVNITAKSLPEAIDLALDNLGVDESEAEIEVLEEPRQGLFGRMRGNARVRARVKPKGTRPKVERGRSRRRRDGEEGGGAAASGGQGRSSAGASGSSGTRSRSRNGSGGGARRSEGGSAGAEGAVAVVDEAGTESRGQGDAAPARGTRSGGGGRSRGEGSGNGRSAGQDREPAEEATVEEVSSQLREFLSGLTRAFGYDSPVEIRSDEEDGLVGSVEGRHGLMVGPRGRTLDAIQELARVSVQRSAPSNIRMKVDVGGYREIRRAALKTFALEAAAAVRLDGRERLLEPMSSADRKVVHDTLSLEDGIETRSAGAEPHRRVVVLAVGGGAAAVAEEPEADEETAASTNGAVHSDPQSVDEPVGDAEDAGAANPEAVADADDAAADEEVAVAAVADGEPEDGSGD